MTLCNSEDPPPSPSFRLWALYSLQATCLPDWSLSYVTTIASTQCVLMMMMLMMIGDLMLYQGLGNDAIWCSMHLLSVFPFFSLGNTEQETSRAVLKRNPSKGLLHSDSDLFSWTAALVRGMYRIINNKVHYHPNKRNITLHYYPKTLHPYMPIKTNVLCWVEWNGRRTQIPKYPVLMERIFCISFLLIRAMHCTPMMKCFNIQNIYTGCFF